MTWVDDPALVRTWQVLRRRVEDRGRRAVGTVVLTGLDRAERHAVSGLVGRPVVGERCRLDLAELDAQLSVRSGMGGLLAVLEAVTGAPVHDRPAERAHRDATREAPFVLARELLSDAEWRDEWLDGVRRAGLLSRTRDPATAVRRAVAVLSGLPSEVARTELAASVAGSAHALDDGRTVTALVLRALAAQRGEPPPTTAAARRELWESAGVRVDAVSTTCLTVGMRASGPGSAAARLRLAHDAGDPVHLTAWDLRRITIEPPAEVLVCENPRVLEAVAERYGSRHPAVCTSGRPALVVLDVLHALAGSHLRYHGDFDWPGVAIANRLIGDVAVVPWRMGAAEYAAGLDTDGLPLSGPPVEPAWDPELGAAMRHHRVAVHEEAVLADLLDALARPDGLR